MNTQNLTDRQPHTPSYEEVREATESDVIFLELGEFDRFLAERDARISAAAEQRGAIKALRDAADIKLGNEYYEILVEDELNARADDREINLLEGDDE